MSIANAVLLIKKKMIDEVFKEMIVGKRYVIVFPLKIIFQTLTNLSFVHLFGFMTFSCFYESHILSRKANPHL